MNNFDHMLPRNFENFMENRKPPKGLLFNLKTVSLLLVKSKISISMSSPRTLIAAPCLYGFL